MPASPYDPLAAMQRAELRYLFDQVKTGLRLIDPAEPDTILDDLDDLVEMVEDIERLVEELQQRHENHESVPKETTHG